MRALVAAFALICLAPVAVAQQTPDDIPTWEEAYEWPWQGSRYPSWTPPPSDVERVETVEALRTELARIERDLAALRERLAALEASE